MCHDLFVFVSVTTNSILHQFYISYQYCSNYWVAGYLSYICFSPDVSLNDTTEEGAVRLVGGATPLEGRVEVFLIGHWGTVCDYNWDLADATVVCHQLGYVRAVEASRYASFGAGSGPSWYHSVECNGTDLSLTECHMNNYGRFGSACSHSRDAGAVCSSESKSTDVALLSPV